MMRSEINFEVRQNMLQISNSLQGRRHFCFDVTPYAIGRWGLRRKRNVCVAASSDLSHFEVESTQPNTALEPTYLGLNHTNALHDYMYVPDYAPMIPTT